MILCNDISENFSEKSAFTPKSKWKPPKDHPNLEVFLSQTEKELFELAESPLNYSNFSNEEWQAMRSLVNDRSVVIKRADKDLFVVEWDHEDYIAEAERQVGDVTVHKDVGFVKNLKNIDHTPHDAIMVTADVVGLYPSIPPDAGLEPLRKALDN